MAVNKPTKGKIMKMKYSIALALTALGTAALLVNAQDNGNDGPPQGGGPGMGGPGKGGRRPPMVPAIVRALDANHDGEIDADEIANAVAVLKTLDKNGDGKLTIEEFMGKPPMRPPQGGNGAGGPPPDGGPGGPPPQQQ